MKYERVCMYYSVWIRIEYIVCMYCMYVCMGLCMYESVCMYYNVYTEYIVCIGVCIMGLCMYESVCMHYNVSIEYIVCIGVCMYGFMYVL